MTFRNLKRSETREKAKKCQPGNYKVLFPMSVTGVVPTPNLVRVISTLLMHSFMAFLVRLACQRSFFHFVWFNAKRPARHRTVNHISQPNASDTFFLLRAKRNCDTTGYFVAFSLFSFVFFLSSPRLWNKKNVLVYAFSSAKTFEATLCRNDVPLTFFESDKTKKVCGSWDSYPLRKFLICTPQVLQNVGLGNRSHVKKCMSLYKGKSSMMFSLSVMTVSFSSNPVLAVEWHEKQQRKSQSVTLGRDIFAQTGILAFF